MHVQVQRTVSVDSLSGRDKSLHLSQASLWVLRSGVG